MPFVTHSFLATLTDSESCPPRRTPAVRQPFVASARCTAASVPNCGPRPWAHRRGTNERASRPSTTRGPTIRTGRKGDRRRCVSPPDDARAEDRRHRAAEIPGHWEPQHFWFRSQSPGRTCGNSATREQSRRDSHPPLRDHQRTADPGVPTPPLRPPRPESSHPTSARRVNARSPRQGERQPCCTVRASADRRWAEFESARAAAAPPLPPPSRTRWVTE